MNKEQYLSYHKLSCDRLVEITRKKNADYTGSSDDPFANFRQIEHLIQKPGVAETGFLTRMSDKMSRVGSFISKGKFEVEDESVHDTLFDLANYCILLSGFIKAKQGDAVSNYKGSRGTGPVAAEERYK